MAVIAALPLEAARCSPIPEDVTAVDPSNVAEVCLLVMRTEVKLMSTAYSVISTRQPKLYQ